MGVGNPYGTQNSNRRCLGMGDLFLKWGCFFAPGERKKICRRFACVFMHKCKKYTGINLLPVSRRTFWKQIFSRAYAGQIGVEQGAINAK